MAKKRRKRPPRIALQITTDTQSRLDAARKRRRQQTGFLNLSDTIRELLDLGLEQDERVASVGGGA